MANIEVLVVAGGGSGGNGGGGGGGAGGLVYHSSRSVTVGSYTVTIGAGGATQTTTNANGNAGEDSVFDTITAVGGGGGGGASGGGGVNGGSGGGGSDNSGSTGAGSATQGDSGGGTGFGNNGGTGSGNLDGSGGGGGSGGVGANGTTNTGGNGGAGKTYTISGSSVAYAGGGGGSANEGDTAGTGQAGGGNGGLATHGSAATANTGSGGGGGGVGGPNNGGAGGSGIVIVSYPTGTLTGEGGTITTSGSNTIHTFTSSGTFQVVNYYSRELYNTTLFSDSTLKAYYRLEGNSNDATANAHNCTDLNAAYGTDYGKFNQGVNFSATGNCYVASHSDFTPTSNFSLGAWIKTTLTTAEHIFISHYRDADGQQQGWKLGVNSAVDDDTAFFHLGNNSCGDGNYDDGTNGFNLKGSRVVNDGLWHHIVATYDGSNMKLYVDGVLDNSRACTLTVQYHASNIIRIGADTYQPNPNNIIEAFNGSIDDVFFFNGKTLTLAEIQSLNQVSPFPSYYQI